MKLKVFVILVLVAAGGAAVFVSLGGLPAGGSTAASTYLTATAATGDVTDEVAATGTIAPTATYILGFGSPPRLADGTASAGSGTWLVETVNAIVGQAVKGGDVLATASTSDLEAQLAAAKTSLSAAKLGEIRLESGQTLTVGLDESTTYHQQADAATSDVTAGKNVQLQLAGRFRPGPDDTSGNAPTLGTAGSITIVP